MNIGREVLSMIKMREGKKTPPKVFYSARERNKQKKLHPNSGSPHSISHNQAEQLMRLKPNMVT